MSISRVYAAQPGVLASDIITIEADLSRGLHSFTVVGLAGKAIEEARDRVSAAIKNTGLPSPKKSNHKITISLAPADTKKDGPIFDTAIALAYLIAAEEVTADMRETLCIGELALDGSLRPVRGILPIVQSAVRAGFSEVIVPADNAEESALMHDITITPARDLGEIIRHIDLSREDHARIVAQEPTQLEHLWDESVVRLEDIRGQESAKRGLLIAAAGRHNSMLVGPPGTGKTMLARAFQGLLLPLTTDEALEVMAIHSIAGLLQDTISSRPPFRTPHHTASHVSLVGGGTHPKPGEVTLAHRGVLFADEFPEFERRAIDALRQPLEDRIVSIARAHTSVTFPANFVLIAAMNPNREGGSDAAYSDQMLDTYRKKISGPILDRIDLWLTVPHVDYATMTEQAEKSNETEVARAAILRARERQTRRFADRGIRTNAEMSARTIDELVPLKEEVRSLLRTSATKLKLSPRSYHRVIKVARTIADLADADTITTEHVLEALQYRSK